MSFPETSCQKHLNMEVLARQHKKEHDDSADGGYITSLPLSKINNYAYERA